MTYACLSAPAADADKLGRIEGVLRQIGLEPRRIGGNGAAPQDLKKARRELRSAQLFIAALPPGGALPLEHMRQLMVAQMGNVPILLVGAEDAAPAIGGPALDQIPSENRIHVGAGFETSLAERIHRVLARTGAPGRAPSVAETDAYDVFISYTARSDTAHAQRLGGFLQEQQIPFWDFQQNRRASRESYAHEVQEALVKSKVMAVIHTSGWQRSQWAFNELQHALHANKKIAVFQFDAEPVFIALHAHEKYDCRARPEDALHRFLAWLDEET